MNFSETFEKAFKRFLPTPFSIALILTLLAFILAYIFTKPPSMDSAYIVSLAEFWQNGLWNAPLLVFAMQMMLMLVLGHTLALAKPINNALDRVIPRLDSTPKAAFWVCLLTLCVAFINWGLGLVFGALFARKVAESSVSNGMKINYPIIGAAGYSGLMVWHGGLSGSAPVKVNEPGHIQSLVTNNAQLLTELPEAIPASETLFGGLNMTTSLLLLTLIPLTFYVLG
ncbi:MAG: TIGR00366 family protein [Schleiferiaceae bacterium]|jgi:short-chain fatty acids transporter|nr:TIGR00366 family protein [Schleiferiaceae bacterium]